MATQPHATEPRGDAGHPAVPSTAIQAATAIEPDLRLIEGIVSVLIHLGERTDPIDAGAVAALGPFGDRPIDPHLRHSRNPPDMPHSTA